MLESSLETRRAASSPHLDFLFFRISMIISFLVFLYSGSPEILRVGG
jgi:hypothetical protein